MLPKLEGSAFKCQKMNVRGRFLKVCECGERGTKPVLVFLHGMPGQISNWKYQLSYFCGRYWCVAYDQRGYGESDKPLRVSLKDYLLDLDEILAHLGVSSEDVVLIGHSFGAMVAQTYARDRKLKGLVLIGSLIKWEVSTLDKIIELLPPFFWKKILFTKNPLTVRVYRNMFFSPRTPKSVFEEFMRDNERYISQLPAHVHRYWKFFSDYDASPWLKDVEVKALIMVGADDKVTPPSWSKEIHRLMPNSKLVVIDGAGHLIMYEKPELVNREIEGFIRSLEKLSREEG
ncbi:MAG TPA: alpha/beta hydrolase [Candidatus Korarchaeota archaeon]|nr:alpha/beta hydrolase [Candidatus Korarchaeota archaeon]